MPYDHRTLHLRRRDSIPLHQIHTMPQSFRRWNKDDDVNYRKTRDIFIDRGYDVPPNLDSVMDTLRSDRSDPMRDQKADQLRDVRDQKNMESKQSQLEKFRRELRWLTINTDEGIGIGIR
ncbi:uncharacterized protein LOC126379531 [Pectinophora gossypiella]|uniref:uncharacterized protein LOC126379531 n=1 Tax=Pectinophora gossypiella TaxID=13191 RepID=UPI00214EAB42|nr:uncharacterized protein LOC126379531 [Pectinophora gossypiella]